MNPFEDQVRLRAYYIWMDEGRVLGRADDHWLQAEGEIRARTSTAPAATALPDLTLSPSPAQVLDKPLKTKTGRTKAVAKEDLLAEAPAAKPAARSKATPKISAAAAEPAPAKTKTASKAKGATKASAAEPAPKPPAAKPARTHPSRAAADATVH